MENHQVIIKFLLLAFYELNLIPFNPSMINQILNEFKKVSSIFKDHTIVFNYVINNLHELNTYYYKYSFNLNNKFLSK